jgi:hypothetical protein
MPKDSIQEQMQFQLSLLRLVCRESAVSPQTAAPDASTPAMEKIEALVKRVTPPSSR